MGNVIIGGGGTDTLVGGKRTLAGTAAARGLSTVDPRLVQIIDAAAARSPYDVQIFSGQRSGSAGGSRHNSGNALDIALIDPSTGEVIPNYKSSTGFPIYAEFAKVAREEQMAIAPDMADQFRWGGGFSDKDFDLMHFDFKPGGSMAYWSWEDGGKLTAAGAAAVPKFGPGYIYANGEKMKAPPGQYASLWGRDPLQGAPQDAQSAIASLMAPSGGTQAIEPPTAAMGFAPTIPDASFGTPPVQTASSPPMPSMPPQWAQAGGFPMDEALTGQSASQVLAGGPRMDPRRSPPGSGPMPPDMGAMRSPADVLNAGPRLRPGGAPDAASVPDPAISPMRPAVGGPNDRRPQPPMPPSRAQGIPDPRMRPDPASLEPRGFPTAFGEQPQPLMGGMSAAMGGAAPSAGGMAASAGGVAPQFGDLSATMGGPPAPPDPFADFGTRDLAAEMQGQRTIADANYYRPQNIMQPPSPPTPATMGERFDAASAQPNADQMFGLPDMNGASFPAPPSPVGTAGAGSTTGEFFTPAPPMPQPGPDPMAGRFDDAFSPAAPGMIADLQGAFNRQQMPPAPPQPAVAQDGINAVFGAPPAPAMPSNLAIPFNEVPGFMGAAPAEAATPELPSMGMGAFNDRFSPSMPAPQPISMGEFDQRFAGGTVAPGGPPPPGTPGIVQGTMPGPMDIRSPAQGGPPMPPQALPQTQPAPAPRQTNVGAEKQRSGTIGRILGGLLGGPIGALGGGLLGGGGGGMFGGGGGFGFGTPSFNATGGGTAPYGGGSTTYQKGTSNALGGSNALSWKSSSGGTITAYTDPNTGQTFHSYGP